MAHTADMFTLGGHFAGTEIHFNFASQNSQDFYAEQVRREGLAAYEAPTPSIIVAIVIDGAGVVLDIGAHTGLLTLLAAAAEPSTIVHAFEPLDKVRAALFANISLNPALSNRIHVHDVALSDSEGVVTFYETINDMGFFPSSSSIELAHAQTIDHGVFREQAVMATRLDCWAAANLGTERLKLLKIDVETHEHAVLRGGMKTLLTHRPMIILEVLPSADTGQHNILLEKGYVAFAMMPDSLVHRQSVSFAGCENYLLCPDERLLDVLRIARSVGLGLRFG